MAARRSRRWIQRALRVRYRRRGLRGDHRQAVRKEALHRGALRRMLRIREGETIPIALLREAAEYPERFYKGEAQQVLLRRRANLALTLRGLGRPRRYAGVA